MNATQKVNKEAKNLLAKLLATENITVLHQQISTAKFDVMRRVLYLPMFKEMSGDLYDMLVAHEVSHALHTPRNTEEVLQGIESRKEHQRGAFGVLNIVEDIRIEKLIKKLYPGIRKVFPTAYKELIDRNFFGSQGTDIKDYLFVDRVNIHFKVGSLMTVPFSDEERLILAELDNMITFGDVVTMTKKLYKQSQDEQAEKKQQELSKDSNPLPNMPKRRPSNEDEGDNDPEECEASGQDSADADDKKS
jgi:hypothetical protein